MIPSVQGPAPDGAVVLDADAVDLFMPMSLTVAASGHIRHAGPTLAKLRPDAPLAGRRLLEVFEPRRPRGVGSFADLRAACGAPLVMAFRDQPRTAFKGHGQALPDGGMLINLSFGIGAVEALAAYDLTGADFAPTDLTVEMLYLVEANAAVQADLRRLTLRLDGAKSAAVEQAHSDTLTGLRNRRALDMALQRYAASREAFALMHLDLDRFKAVNDTRGHAAGDHVLQQVAAILREETREADTVARVGGDEFVLIFYRLTERRRLARIASRLLRRLSEPVEYDGARCEISGSIGIALSQDYPRPDPDRMLQDADAALYRSKRAGRARYGFAGEDATHRPEAGEPPARITPPS
ncbi:diguanylate cyclase domain-containing protein [Psychromarinibacter sp. S121]|uniref:diguanylate cyclase domain-containing protein n=1 Tax=Psychromarinibacter sp. S121 TaxID=3415127 RepID=UPI003C7C5C30